MSSLSSYLTYNVSTESVQMQMINQGAAGVLSVTILDNVYNLGGPWHYTLAAGQSATLSVPTTASGHWYDLSLLIDTPANLQWRHAAAVASGAAIVTPTVHGQKSQPLGAAMLTPSLQLQPYLRRFMGRMETGVDSISDPAMSMSGPHLSRSGVDPLDDADHPELPLTHTHFSVTLSGSEDALGHVHQLPLQPPAKNDHKDARFYPREDQVKTEL